jgi:endoglucanase
VVKDNMKGINLGGWFSQIDAIEEKDPSIFPGIDNHIKSFLESDDFQRISRSGFDHVRLPIDYQIFFSDEGELIYKERMALLERAVEEITQSGLILILDLHECPGHDFDDGVRFEQDFFTDQKKREAARRVWTQLCSRFGNNPLIYLEILNEPVAPNDDLWNSIKQEMAGHIRSLAENSTLVIGSNRWNSPSTFANLKPLDDPNVLYSFHFYSPLLFTHQRVPWVNDPLIMHSREYPGDYKIHNESLKDIRLEVEKGLWNKERITREIEPVLRFRDTFGLQVSCNEFGVFHQAPRESQLRWISDFISILKEHGIGYSYWNYKNLDFGLISIGEQLHQDLPQFDNEKRLDQELLELLSNSSAAF